jgi:hypothetical protein
VRCASIRRSLNPVVSATGVAVATSSRALCPEWQRSWCQALAHTLEQPCRFLSCGEAHDIERKVGAIGWEVDIGVAIANEVRDAVEANIDFVRVQMVEFAVEFCDRCIEFWLGRISKGIWMETGELRCKEREVLVPLGSCESSLPIKGNSVANAMQFYGALIVRGGKRSR